MTLEADKAKLAKLDEFLAKGNPQSGIYAKFKEVADRLRAGIDTQAGFVPGPQEQKLLDLIGSLGQQELEKMRDGRLFELDDATRQEIQNITNIRTDSARDTAEFGLDRAVGQASGGSASRGLPRGSLRAELTARLSGPVLDRLQQQVAGINADAANLRIRLPRQDAAFRQQVLQSPALTALQRTRLSTADLRLRFRNIKNAEKARKDAAKASKFGALGKIAGAAVGFAVGGPPGAAAGAGIGGAGADSVSGGFDSSVTSGSAYSFPGADEGSFLT